MNALGRAHTCIERDIVCPMNALGCAHTYTDVVCLMNVLGWLCVRAHTDIVSVDSGCIVQKNPLLYGSTQFTDTKT